MAFKSAASLDVMSFGVTEDKDQRARSKTGQSAGHND